MAKARVYKSAKREFTCRLLETKELVQAKALGNLLKKGESIVVGDYVEVEMIEETKEYVISSLYQRSSEIFRILIREGKKKVTASNVDTIVILTSVSKPQYKRGIVDRFLVRAFQWQVEPIVIFNKMDEYNREEFDLQFEQERLKDLNVKCFEISAKQSAYEPQYLEKGYRDLKEYLSGKTSVFLGQSGVGKSQTITALSEGEVELKTKKVGKVGKGSHTTTWSEIIDCHNFELIDSPGIRSFSLDDITSEDLLSFFPDLEEYAVHCKFNDCSHEPSAKGCRFWKQDLAPDSEKGSLVHSRLDSYCRFLEEISETTHWQKSDKYS